MTDDLEASLAVSLSKDVSNLLDGKKFGVVEKALAILVGAHVASFKKEGRTMALMHFNKMVAAVVAASDHARMKVN